MDRWTGALRIPLRPSASVKVAASLCCSLCSTTLTVPSANAIFFAGDRVEGTGNPVIEELSDPRNIAELLVSKLGMSVNAWVIEASTFSGPFAVYKELVPSVDGLGHPRRYDPEGFPASSSIVQILSGFVEQVENIISPGQPDQQHVDIHLDSFMPSSPAKTILFGFSKGGVVINQILTELAHLQFVSGKNIGGLEKSSVGSCRIDWALPSSNESFLCSIADIHYVDVGLNTSGAYITNNVVVEAVGARLLKNTSPPMRFVFHGTPRQWCDARRVWICKEKDKLREMLEKEARRCNGRLDVTERFYYAGMPPSLQMHFEIIRDMDTS